MKRILFVSGILILLFACHKKPNTTNTTTSFADSCEGQTLQIDRIQFTNWDKIPDTLDLYIYEHGNNFTKSIAGFLGNDVGDDGYIEGLPIFLGDDSAREFKIKLRHHSQVYKLKNYISYIDSADCSKLNDSIRCFNSFSFILNDSLVYVPKTIDNYEHYNAYTLKLHL